MLRTITNSIVKPKTKFARVLRKNQTPAEKILWNKIRNKKFQGFKMRRQVPVGPYIADFMCVEKLLIIEIDGDSHYEPGAKERDSKREEYLRSQGFRVVRFGGKQTVESVDSVLRILGEKLGCDFF